MKRIIQLTLLLLSIVSISMAQQVKKSTYGDVLLKGATLHTMTHGTMVSDLLIADGMIKSIGTNLSADGATVIDCSGKHIYPGFIDGGTRLGLAEVSAVSLTVDHSEIGDFIPQMQALTAVNPNTVAIPVTRTNGVTTVIAKPGGGIFPGTAALIDLQGYTPGQMYAGFRGVIMNFPRSGRGGWWDRRSDDDIKKANEKAMKKINDIWSELEVYARIDSAEQASGIASDEQRYMPEYDALMPVYRGEIPLMVEANKDSDIKNAIKWLKDHPNVKAILTGVAEGWRVADEIAESGYPVITGPVLSVPGRGYVRYDVNYKNPAIMHKAGVKVALRTNDTENVRNLPFNAGYAATYGMGIEEALKAITIVPAEMFGLGDKYGSLDEGKVANLFVSDGDPFEMKTRISHLFINGWNIPMESRHTLFYDEFLERSPGLKK